jgi:aminoglycoside 3-N-acetyltransferase
MDIARQLQHRGLRRGDWLGVFGDLTGEGEDAPDDAEIDRFLDTLVSLVGEAGHLLVPTFTLGAPFDPAETPAATGRVAERFRRRPDVTRSHHPSHSVAVRGPDARAIILDHDLYLPFRPETPLGRLAVHEGWVLLLGDDQRANGLIHVARLAIERPRPVLWFNVDHILEFGGRRKKRHVEPPCDRAYSALGTELLDRGIAQPLDTDYGRMTWMATRPLCDYIQTIERQTPERFLCDDPDCRWCRSMRWLLNQET